MKSTMSQKVDRRVFLGALSVGIFNAASGVLPAQAAEAAAPVADVEQQFEAFLVAQRRSLGLNEVDGRISFISKGVAEI
jgi:hypothetical protein